MKKLFILILITFSTQVFSQTKTDILSKKKMSNMLSCEYERKIDLSKSDTTHCVICTFQNREYQHIKDRGIYSIYSKEQLDETINDLKECIRYMDEKSISFSKGNFRIYDSSKSLYIYYNQKYTWLPKRLVLKWITWLEEIQSQKEIK